MAVNRSSANTVVLELDGARCMECSCAYHGEVSCGICTSPLLYGVAGIEYYYRTVDGVKAACLESGIAFIGFMVDERTVNDLREGAELMYLPSPVLRG